MIGAGSNANICCFGFMQQGMVEEGALVSILSLRRLLSSAAAGMSVRPAFLRQVKHTRLFFVMLIGSSILKAANFSHWSGQ